MKRTLGCGATQDQPLLCSLLYWVFFKKLNMENLRHIPKTRWLSHYGSHHSASAVIKLMAPCPLWSPKNRIILKQILVIILQYFSVYLWNRRTLKNITTLLLSHLHIILIVITIQCLNFLVIYCMCVHTQIFFFSNSLLKQDPNKRYIYRLLLFTSPIPFVFYLLLT